MIVVLSGIWLTLSCKLNRLLRAVYRPPLNFKNITIAMIITIMIIIHFSQPIIEFSPVRVSRNRIPGNQILLTPTLYSIITIKNIGPDYIAINKNLMCTNFFLITFRCFPTFIIFRFPSV